MLEWNVASKLTDSDLSSILFHIDARTKTRTLKLNGCMSIVGYGLEPLRISTVIEEIDIRVWKNLDEVVCNRLDEELKILREKVPMLDEENLVPILSSLLSPEAASTSLLFIHFPKHWRDRKRPVLTAFFWENLIAY